MILKKLSVVIITLLFCNLAFGAVFTVTSNADSGPGTLRQALLDAAANGTSPTDYIYFNLPGTTLADVTITVKTQLPDVTANVVIDGTTQPGTFLGVSNAKIVITVATPAFQLNAFNVSDKVTPTDAVEFYGLDIQGFGADSRGYGAGIVTNADCKLVIGAPGKGNVISGNSVELSGYFVNAKIQANFIGLEPDGETPLPGWTTLYSNEDYDNLLIGGPDPAEGNVIINGYDDGIKFGFVSFATIYKTVTIESNLFGTNYNATKVVRTNYYSFISVNDYYTTLVITGNVFSAGTLAIDTYNQTDITVTGNFFGTNKTQTIPLGTGGEAISLNGGTAVVGGNNAADQNVFTNYDDPFFNPGSPVEVIKNTFYCNNDVELWNGGSVIRIIKLLDNEVSGDAAPGALVQLYFTTSACPNCNPVTWFATVTADANGIWDYKGNTTQNIMASATVGNNTSGFQPYTVSPNEVTVTDIDCHHPGSIKLNEQRFGRFKFVWTDSKGNIISTAQEADNLPAGEYYLQISEGGACPIAKGQFEVINLKTQVYSATIQLDCASPTATIYANPYTVDTMKVTGYYWTDASGKVISNASSISGLGVGNYYLYVTDSNGCNSDTALYQVLPPVNAPVVDDSKAVIHDADCDRPDGSITGVTFTNGADATYGWVRTTDGMEFSPQQTTLANAPPGQYYFFVQYNYNCPPVESRTFTIGSANAINIDDSKAVIIPATCSNANGGIKGIIVTGAQTYQWYNDQNQQLSPSADLSNVPPGNYYLVAANQACSKQSQVYAIASIPANVNFPSVYQVSDASCGLSNGGVAISFTGGAAPQSYRWVSGAGLTLQKDAPLTNAPSGAYTLFVTDQNDCESPYNTFTIHEIPPLQLGQDVTVTNDQCGHGTGSINDITVSGGLAPYSYSWKNQAGESIAQTATLGNLQAGIYSLQVNDVTGCNTASASFTVSNETTDIRAPDVDNLEICSAGQIILKVKAPQTGYGYRLYNTITGGAAVDDRQDGIFSINVTKTGSVFVSAYTGNCESPRIAVNIIVGLSSINIPNTFTPNGDGVNDVWNINGLDNYPGALVQIFTRSGQKVFGSLGYAKPFDGKMGNSPLPEGVYYYIINLNSGCSLLSGSLTLIR